MAVGIPLIVLLLMQRGLALQRTREKEHLRHGKSKDSARHARKVLFHLSRNYLFFIVLVMSKQLQITHINSRRSQGLAVWYGSAVAAQQ